MGRLRDLVRGNVILARKQQRFKQSDIATALGLTAKTVSDWERGRATPSYDHLDELAKFYGFEDGSEWFGVIRPEAMALIMDADKMREDLILKMAEEISRKRAAGGDVTKSSTARQLAKYVLEAKKEAAAS